MDNEVIGHKVFRINNISGKSQLQISDGQTDKFSLVLLGGDQIYVNMEYILEAQVTMCRPTQDYHVSFFRKHTEFIVNKYCIKVSLDKKFTP